MADEPRGNIASIYGRSAEPRTPRGSVTGAAFRLNNDIVNLFEMALTPEVRGEPTFDWRDHYDAKTMSEDWLPRLAAARSEADFQTKLAKLKQETADRELLAASGASGFLTSLAAGAISPTMLIPFMGQARGARAIGEVLGYAAVAGVTQEGILYANQELATGTEFLAGVGMQTALAGALGGAWLGLSKAGRARLLNQIEDSSRHVDIPQGSLDIGPDGNVRRVAAEEIDLPGPRPRDLEGRDRVATTRAVEEPVLPAGRVRYYFAGDAAEASGQPLSRLREETAASAPDSPLYYVDLDASDLPTGDSPIITLLNPNRAEGLREVFRGETPTANAVARPRESGEEVTEAREPGMARQPDNQAIRDNVDLSESPGTQAAGAAVAGKHVNTKGMATAPNKFQQGLLDALGKVNPVYRMGTSMFRSIRDGVFRLDSSGLRQAGLESLEPSAMGGSVMDRKLMHDFPLVKLLETMDREYYRHLYGREPENFARVRLALAQVKSTVSMVPEGKMTWKEFDEAVFEASNTGKVPAEVRDSVAEAQRYQEWYRNTAADYHKELAEVDPEVAPLFEAIEGDELGPGVENYVHHRYDPRKITDNSDHFIQTNADYLESHNLSDYRRDFRRMSKKREQLRLEADIGSLSMEGKSVLLDAVEGEIATLAETSQMGRYFDGLETLRKSDAYVNADRATRAKMTRQYHDDLDPEVAAVYNDWKEARGRATLTRRLGGEDSERLTSFREEKEKAEDLLSSMLEKVQPRLAKLDRRIVREGESFDRFAKQTLEGLERAEKGIQKYRDAVIDAARKGGQSPEQLAQLREVFAKRLARYEEAMARYNSIGPESVHLEERLAELETMRSFVLEDITHLARRRGERIARAEEGIEGIEAKQLSAEEAANFARQKHEELFNLEQDFNAKWAERGERSGDPSKGSPDFREAAIEDATYFYQKLTGSQTEPGYFLAKFDRRGPQLKRMMMIPFDQKKQWLDTSMESVSRSYTAKMGADLELYRALDGRPNGSSVKEAMNVEAHKLYSLAATSKYVKLPKGFVSKADGFGERVRKRIAGFGESEDIHISPESFTNEPKAGFVEMTSDIRGSINRFVKDELEHQSRNWDIAVQRIRGSRSQAINEGGFMHRSGRLIKDLNVLTMMGMVTVSSIPDAARPLMQYRMSQVVGNGWAPYLSGMKGQSGRTYRQVSLESNAMMGSTLEVQMGGRAKEFMDLAHQFDGKRSVVERGVSALAGKVGAVGLFDLQTALFKNVAADIYHATAGVYIPKVAAGLRKGSFDAETQHMLEWLRQRGLRDNDITRIADMMAEENGMEHFSNGAMIPNFGEWDDMRAFRAYAGAANKEVNKLVITPGLERPNWTDENLAYSLLAQFQSFLFGAHSRMLMSGVQGNEPYLLTGILASLGAGAMAYYLSGVSRGKDAMDEIAGSSPKKWLYMAIDRSGLLGALHLPMGWGAEVPGLNDYWLFGGGEPGSYRDSASIAGAIGGPTGSQILKGAQLLSDVGNPDKIDKTLARARRLFLPYQNNFLLRQPMDAVAEGLGF